MKKNNKKLKLFSLILLIIFCLYFQTVVYSAISSKLMITGDAVARIRSNVRINKFRIHEVSNGVISSYEEFSKTYTMSNVTLPNSDSYIIYELVIGNYEDVEMQLSNITGLPSNLTYELIDYSLHDMICDNTNKCFGGVEKTLYLKIKYANYNSSGTNYNINLEYEFKEFSNTLMSGISFRDTIPASATHLVFTDEKPANGTVLTDVSLNKDMGVVGYLDGTTYKVSTRRTGVMPEANERCNSMFSGSTLTNIDLSNLDTNNAISMNSMFYNCTNLTNIIFGEHFNTKKVESMSSMFQGCTNLLALDLSNFDTSSVTTMQRMFTGCSLLEVLNVSGFDTASVTTMYSMFADCPNLAMIDVSNFDTSKTTIMYSMFRNCSSLVEIDVSNFDTSNVTTMESMFYNCSKLVSLNLNNFNTSSLTNMHAMFASCLNLANLDLSNFNTSSVTRMDSMFYNCKSLTTLDLSNFNTSNVNTMESMFQYCTSLTSLNVSNFDTSNVISMYAMFAQNTSLKSIDLSNFNTGKVTHMSNMFNSSHRLEKIYIGDGWNISNVTSSNSMFNNCTSLPNFDTSYIDVSKAYVGEGGYLSRLSNVSIDGVSYRYEEGMTWRDWVDSSFDTRGFVNNNDLIYTDDLTYALVYEVNNGSYTSYSWPYATDLIDPNLVYVTFNESGEDGEG